MSIFRHPKTTQERRDSATNGKNWTRAKRNKANLIEAWDDTPRQFHRNWKHYRKTQYRIVKM